MSTYLDLLEKVIDLDNQQVVITNKTTGLRFTGQLFQWEEASPGDWSEGLIVRVTIPDEQFDVSIPTNHWDIEPISE